MHYLDATWKLQIWNCNLSKTISFQLIVQQMTNFGISSAAYFLYRFKLILGSKANKNNVQNHMYLNISSFSLYGSVSINTLRWMHCGHGDKESIAVRKPKLRDFFSAPALGKFKKVCSLCYENILGCTWP